MPATVPRSHAALQQQAQAFSAIAKALGNFGDLRWLTLDAAHRQALLDTAAAMPPAPSHLGETEAAQRRQPLHAMLSLIQQTVQDMARLAGQPPLSPRVITPAMLNAFVPAVHYGGVTIDGPHRDEAGQAHFYLERQCGHACAQHAVNAMVGGPLVSLAHFAHWEVHLQAGQGATSAFVEEAATVMRAHGVHAETVQGTLQALGMPMHCHVHRPLVNAQGVLGLDPVQARFLDGLQTDRLLLQADRYEGDGASSHYVAFRREGGQWVLLDSLEGVPQQGVAPSAYLLGDERIRHFTALWPQHALQGSAAVDRDGRREQAEREGYASAPVRVPQGRGTQARSEVRRKFLAGLVPYAAGKSLIECERESGLASFGKYLLAAGGLQKRGQALHAKLTPEGQAEVDRAIGARKVARVQNALDTASVMEKFLAGLMPYAAGKSLIECERESGLAGFRNYFSAAGGLQEKGQALHAKLTPERQAEVEAACLSRTVWFARENITSGQFLDALRRFSSSSLPLKAIEQAVGLKKGCLGLLLCDTGLTEAGRRYVEAEFDAQTQVEIQGEIRRRVSSPP